MVAWRSEVTTALILHSAWPLILKDDPVVFERVVARRVVAVKVGIFEIFFPEKSMTAFEEVMLERDTVGVESVCEMAAAPMTSSARVGIVPIPTLEFSTT